MCMLYVRIVESCKHVIRKADKIILGKSECGNNFIKKSSLYEFEDQIIIH